MWETLKEHPVALAVSITGHLILLGVLLYNFNFDSIPSGASGEAAVEPMKAVAMNDDLVQAEIQKLKKAEAEKKQREDELKALEKKREAEEVRLQQIKEQRAAEKRKQEKQAAEAKKRKEEESKRQAEKERQLEEQRKLEAQKKAEEKKREETRIAEEKRQEAERQAELKKQREEAERERIAALEAERRREEERIAKIAAEQQAALNAEVDAKKQRRLAGVRAQYKNQIAQKVSRNWIKPVSLIQAATCEVKAYQDPSGYVLEVSVLSCTGGGEPMRRSVQSAVLKASPLPLPSDMAVFERELLFEFKPN